MTVRILVDTNVLAYVLDAREPRKQERAVDTLERLFVSGRGALSTQVLGELYAVYTRRLRPALSAPDAAAQIGRLARSWTVLAVTAQIVLEAVRGATTHRLAYWDAQLWATARLNQVPLVLSEDFQHEHDLEGVSFVNPFSASFDPAAIA